MYLKKRKERENLINYEFRHFKMDLSSRRFWVVKKKYY